jgi:dihydroorotase
MTHTLFSPLDMHLHLRDEAMLKVVAPLSAHSFAGGIIMPNVVPSITTIEAVIAYKERIISAIGNNVFDPLMTLFFRSDYTREFLEKAALHVKALKLYPSGITTNSEGGVASMDIETLRPVLEAMSDLGLVLCVHGETNGFVMDREKEFGSIYESLAKAFPKLKIVMEHITTKESVALLDTYENLYATITLHHLLITLDDVVGGMLQPHLFCKPIAKRYADRDALLHVSLQAHPKVMFGSDSAPHPIHKKECCGCAAGIFTAPIALQALVELFDKHNTLASLQTFVSNNAQTIYGYKPLYKEVVLEKTPMIITHSYGDVVPMFANETLAWSIKHVL